MVLIVTIISCAAALTIAIVSGIWKLSTAISTGHAQLASDIAQLDSKLMQKVQDVSADLRVMKVSEDASKDKLNEVYSWWLSMLKNNSLDRLSGVNRDRT